MVNVKWHLGIIIIVAWNIFCNGMEDWTTPSSYKRCRLDSESLTRGHDAGGNIPFFTTEGNNTGPSGRQQTQDLSMVIIQQLAALIYESDKLHNKIIPELRREILEVAIVRKNRLDCVTQLLDIIEAQARVQYPQQPQTSQAEEEELWWQWLQAVYSQSSDS